VSPIFVPAPARLIQIVSTVKAGAYGLSHPNVSTGVATNGNARCAPVYFPRACVIDRLAFEAVTAGEAGAVERMGVWADTGDLFPGVTLFDDGGRQLVDTTGIKEISPNAALVVDGVGGYIDTPNAAPVQVTGDIDLRFRGSSPNWHAARTIAHKGAGSSWYWYMNGTGGFSLGVTVGAVTSWGNYNTDLLLPAGSKQTLRITRVAATGLVTFYTSPDNGGTWNSLGTASTNVGALDNSASSLAVGQTGGGVPLWAGGVEWFELRNGIGGPVVASFDASKALPTSPTAPTTYTSPTGEVWTTHGSAGSAWSWQYGLAIPMGVSWFGGAAQNCPTTGPSIRVGTQGQPCGPSILSDLAQTSPGFIYGGINGAFPATWQAAASRAGIVPRVAWRIAA
jgi:hypothetical protein